jgi:hypothetical protein
MNIKTLNEMPLVTNDINKKLMVENFEKFMQDKDESDFIKLDSQDFFKIDGVWYSYIIHYTKESGVTAFMKVSQYSIDDGNDRIKVICQSDTLNDTQMVKGFTLNVFKDLSDQYKKPILIDYKNSKDMETTFKKWIDNPEKYGIKDFFVYDNKLKKLLKDSSELEDHVWDTTPQSIRYSILFDFFGFIKECFEDHDEFKKLNEQFRGTKIFFDREAFEKKTKIVK